MKRMLLIITGTTSINWDCPGGKSKAGRMDTNYISSPGGFFQGFPSISVLVFPNSLSVFKGRIFFFFNSLWPLFLFPTLGKYWSSPLTFFFWACPLLCIKLKQEMFISLKTSFKSYYFDNLTLWPQCFHFKMSPKSPEEKNSSLVSSYTNTLS